MPDFSIAVVPRTHNSYGAGSNPAGRTILKRTMTKLYRVVANTELMRPCRNRTPGSVLQYGCNLE